MTKTVMDDARLAVALREEAEQHRVGESYLHAGELMREAADAIERLQNSAAEPKADAERTLSQEMFASYE